MKYPVELIKDVFICGWNDSMIDNPFRWYSDCALQLVYNYGRIEGNNEIIVSIPPSNWIYIINEYYLKTTLCELID